MEKGKKELFYGLLTVKLSNPPVSPEETYAEIKKALGLSNPQIDDDFGVVSHWTTGSIDKMKAPGEEFYVVGVETKALQTLIENRHPNVVGCMHAMGYAGGHPPLHLNNKQPASPQSPARPKSPGPKP